MAIERIVMITIDPLAEVALPHRAYPLAIAVSGHIAVVSSADGTGSLVSPNLASVTPFQVGGRPKGIAIFTDGRVIAVADGGPLVILTGAPPRQSQRIAGLHEACHFDLEGRLGVANAWTPITCAWRCETPAKWEVIAKGDMPDPFGDSLFGFVGHPDGKHVCVTAVAGQDGAKPVLGRTSAVHRSSASSSRTWISRRIRASTRQVTSSWSSTGRGAQALQVPPWANTGGDVLAVRRRRQLHGYSVAFVDPGHALLGGNEGQLYIVELESHEHHGRSLHPRS